MFRNIVQLRCGAVVGKRTFIKDTFKYSQCDPPPGCTPVCCGSARCPPPPCMPPPCPAPPPRPPIPPNPCCPHFYEGGDKFKRFRNFFLFVSLPLILLLTYKHIIAAPHKDDKGECQEWEFMMRRTKRFPWGDGTKSLFHNDKFNHLPGECQPPAPCDDD